MHMYIAWWALMTQVRKDSHYLPSIPTLDESGLRIKDFPIHRVLDGLMTFRNHMCKPTRKTASVDEFCGDPHPAWGSSRGESLA